MNCQLHHKWNAERDAQRGSDVEGTPIYYAEDVAIQDAFNALACAIDEEMYTS